MTTVPAPVRSAPDWVGRLHVNQWRVVVSEWTKLRSLRSTLWSLFVAVVFTIGLPCVFATVTAVRWSGTDEGRMAVQLLLNRLGNRSAPVQRVMLSTELITRDSCAPPPK